MNNGMESMLDMYLFETNSLLEQLEDIMLEAEKAKCFSTDNINVIFRIMHTIKGSSAMMEFDSLTKIAHRIEDLFFFFRANNCVDTFSEETRTELFNLMFRSNDFMRVEVSKIENDEPLSINIDQFLNDINTFIEKIKGSPTKEETEQPLPANDDTPKAAGPIPETNAPFLIRIFFDDGCGMEHLRAFMIQSSVKEQIGDDFTCFPADVETNSETCNEIIDNGFFLCLASEDLVEVVLQVVKQSLNVTSFEVIINVKDKKDVITPEQVSETIISAPVAKTPSALAPEVPKAQAPVQHQGQSKQSIISVTLSKLDALMAIVGEIVITESMVTSSQDLKGLKLDNFTKSARQLRKLTDELQDITMSIRMIPISGAFNKMNRVVRDMCQKLGKDVRLTIIGENTELDKTIVDSINDPLMHIVRNSMDHGIEANVNDRIAAEKDPQGEITLEAEHTGSDVLITITDDGTGVDPAKILEKAKQNGILTKPENEYSKREILNLLLAPGFSTNEAVTEFSGRGVGMDVVKQNIEKVGGIVSISSELGEGTCIMLKIPLTMAIVDGMEVAVGGSVFTIPITNIRQSFKITKEEIILDSMNNEVVERMGDFYPVIRLHQLYDIETEITNVEDGILVWVESSDKSYCLFVDELIGEQQVVVKPLPAYLNSFNIKQIGIAGCTILGDGNISIILDILNLHAASVSAY